MALGMVMQLPDQDDETSVSRRQLLAKLDVCMGGRVAEELIFGESNITTGMLRTRTTTLGVIALANTTSRVIWVTCVMHSCLHATAYTSLVVRLASGVSNPCVFVVPVVSVQHDDGCPLVRMTQVCKCIPTACGWGHVLRQLHKASLSCCNTLKIWT